MNITVPTLVIWGEKDTALLTGNLEGLDQYVKNLRVERIPDGSHWVIHEQSKLVIRSPALPGRPTLHPPSTGPDRE